MFTDSVRSQLIQQDRYIMVFLIIITIKIATKTLPRIEI